VRPNGYPERILYRFADQEWIWQIADRAERADIYDMPGIPLGAEGVLKRCGHDRKVVTAMGSIDWWRDGRERNISPIWPAGWDARRPTTRKRLHAPYNGVYYCFDARPWRSCQTRRRVLAVDPSPDYDGSDEIEYFFGWFAWALRGVYPPPGYPPE